MMFLYLFSFSYFMFVNSATINQNCATVSLTEDELRTLKDVAGNLKSFFSTTFEEGQNDIRKVLEEHDPSLLKRIKLTEDSSSVKILLQHQMFLHQEIKQMLTEIKQLIENPNSPNFDVSRIKNEIFLSDQSENNEKKNLKMDAMDSRGDIVEKDLSKNNLYISTDTTFRPADCSELLVAGYTLSGVYRIYPFKCRCTKPVKVFCDMETDGGGWTVFLSRINVSKPINFTRNWEEYKNGFGSPENEYWLGNEALHLLTTTKNYILRMEAKDGLGREIWGEWNSFSVNHEEDKYRLLVTTHNAKSTAFDRFSYVHNNQFSTFDADNDKWGNSCSLQHKGGWWYNQCVHNNPTGIFGKESAEGIVINPWSKTDKVIRYAQIMQLKIRPKICSSQISVIQLNKHNCALNE